MDCNHGCARNSGLTLIELIIVLAIIAILFSIAIPSLSSAIRSTQLSTQKNRFISAMHFTRSEAVKRNKTVYICARSGLGCS